MKKLPPEQHSATPQQVAWRLFLIFHAVAQRKIDDGLIKQNCISFDDYDVLITLNEAEGETLRMSALAEGVLLSNSGISRRVVRLVAQGLVHREQCSQDGRVFRVRLSRKGAKALDRAWVVYKGLIEQSFASLITDAEARNLGLIFDRVLNRIGGEQHQNLLKLQQTDAPRMA